MAEILFWALCAFIVYAFAGFPVLVLALGAVLRRDHAAADVTPSVSVLIAAYNEADVIVEKLRNTLVQQYPDGAIEVVVVDDGSEDGTADLVRGVGDPRIRLLELPRRGGKVTALNRGIEACTGEIVVLTDANAIFEPEALVRLVRPFADPAVGGVCGNQLNRRGASALAKGDTFYWEYDKLLKRMESRTGSIVSADGSIYAIRREHFETVPLGVTDDFFISTGVVRAGRRLVFEDRARSIEDPLERRGDHFARRVRITAQAMQSLAARRELMNPFRTGIYSVILVGHKLVRRLAAPAFFVLLPVSVAAAPAGWVYQVALAAQLAVYVAALVGYVLRGHVLPKLLGAPYYFVLGAWGTTVGMIRYLSGKRSLMWEPVRR